MTLAIDGVGSHMPVLAAMVAYTNSDYYHDEEAAGGGPILELGMGDFSTPYLNLMARTRFVWSLESDKAWHDKFVGLPGFHHEIALIKDWDKQRLFEYGLERSYHDKWAVVLVDHSPGERRVKDIDRLRAKTDFFVVHDAEDSPVANYGFAKCFASFKYVWKWGACNVDTAVLSDRYPIPLEGL